MTLSHHTPRPRDAETPEGSLSRIAPRRPPAPVLPSQPRVPEPHKPPLEMADLLIMSSLDTKTPVLAPGTGDLLDTLVQDHLDRAAAPADAAPSDAADSANALAGAIEAALAADPAAPAPAPTPLAIPADPPVAPAAPVNDDLLKREIETLLRGSDAPGPVAHDALPQEVYTDTAPALPSSAEDVNAVTAAELQTLLESPAATPSTTLAPPAPPKDAAQQVSEAEDILAAELAQLMAEAQTSMDAARQVRRGEGEKATPSANSAAPEPRASETASDSLPPSELPARSSEDLSASIQQIMTASAAPPDPAPSATAQAPGVSSSHDNLPGDISEVPDAPAPPLARRPGLLQRTHNTLTGVVLLLAQLLDVPFAWLNELDKNVIGVIAFLLLLSGCALYAVSLYFH